MTAHSTMRGGFRHGSKVAPLQHCRMANAEPTSADPKISDVRGSSHDPGRFWRIRSTRGSSGMVNELQETSSDKIQSR